MLSGPGFLSMHYTCSLLPELTTISDRRARMVFQWFSTDPRLFCYNGTGDRCGSLRVRVDNKPVRQAAFSLDFSIFSQQNNTCP